MPSKKFSYNNKYNLENRKSAEFVTYLTGQLRIGKNCICKILCLILILLSFNCGNNASAQQYSEYDLKGVYLYNFINFVSWPKEDIIYYFDNPVINFHIGIYGENPFGNILEVIGKQQHRPNHIWHIDYYQMPEEIDSCNLLFISRRTKPSDLRDVLKAVKGKGILTVGDEITNFCEMGGMINFTPGYKKPFEINTSEALAEKLTISPKIIKLSVLKHTTKN